MTTDTLLQHTIQGAASGALFIALIARGRWRLCCSFTAYVAVGVVMCFITTVWPERFYNHATYLPYLALIDILKVGIGLETGWRTFRAFPGAASTARKATLIILAATVLAVAGVPVIDPHSTSFETTMLNFHPRATDGAIWLMAAVLVIARWYRVPVDRFHSSVLTSQVAYTAFFSWVLRLFVGHDFEATRLFINALDGSVILILTCWWIHVAWRAENGTDRLHVNTLRTLQGRAYS
jgi:hypothetical protein